MEDNSPLLKKTFISDEPEVERDYFKRISFAQQISNSITSRKEPNSIVIGIYGEWGEGKTTVLNFIEKEFKMHDKIICVRYNPWYYSDEVMLIQDFFNVLADELRKLSFLGNLNSYVRKYGKHISQFATNRSTSVSIGFIRLNPFSSGSFFDLVKLKKKIQADLRKNNVRVVVLMDDIDRLDKREIHSIFKLVKLSADFNYIDYVLAFDEEMVASAVAEKYGSSNIESGREFLEKIINVPLHLPQIGETSLFKYLHDGIVGNVLPIIKTKLNEEELEIFFNQFRKGLQVKLKTPRMAKRYQNALIFALPILGDEVNIVDLMLIEGVRVFYPKMYNLIRNNAQAFLSSNSLFDTLLKDSFEKIKTEIESLPYEEQEPFKDLIAFLFPGSQRFSNPLYSSYPDYGQQLLTRKKRIASLHYFNRYFSYAVPLGDISDLEIDNFIESINRNEDIDNISFQILELVNANGPGSAESFISQIYRVKNKLNSKTSQKLALAISNLPSEFEKNSDLYLVLDLLKTMPLDTRISCSKKIIESTRSICFILSIFRRVKEDEMQFSVENIKNLEDILKNRICNEIRSESEPIYIRYPCGAFIFRFLLDCGFKERVSKYIEKTISLKSNYSLRFLKCFYMLSFSSDRGLKTFESDNYDSLKKLIDPDILYSSLHKTYADILENPKFEDENDEDIRFLKSFSQIHQWSKNNENIQVDNT